LIPAPGAAGSPRPPAVFSRLTRPAPPARRTSWHLEDPPSRAYGGRSPMATNPTTPAPNTSLLRTPAAAPPSPVSSKPFGDLRTIGLLAALACSACASTPSGCGANQAEVPTVPYCELITHAAQYDGQRVVTT